MIYFPVLLSEQVFQPRQHFPLKHTFLGLLLPSLLMCLMFSLCCHSYLIFLTLYTLHRTLCMAFCPFLANSTNSLANFQPLWREMHCIFFKFLPPLAKLSPFLLILASLFSYRILCTCGIALWFYIPCIYQPF